MFIEHTEEIELYGDNITLTGEAVFYGERQSVSRPASINGLTGRVHWEKDGFEHDMRLIGMGPGVGFSRNDLIGVFGKDEVLRVERDGSERLDQQARADA